MAKINDLRIGNSINNGTIISLHEYGATLAGCYNISGMTTIAYKDLISTSITKEWLLEHGFVIREESYHIWYIIEHNHTKYAFVLNDEYDKSNGNCGIMGKWIDEEEIPAPKNDDLDHVIKQEQEWIGFAWNIKYVHELQNLYYSLTGEELKIHI